jgi:hypothetical protein
MRGIAMALDELKELLTGYVDPKQQRIQRQYNGVAIGDTGLTARIATVNYFRAYVGTIMRFSLHHIARHFIGVLRHELQVSKSA